MSRLYLGTCVYVHVPTTNEKRGHGSERAREGGHGEVWREETEGGNDAIIL